MRRSLLLAAAAVAAVSVSACSSGDDGGPAAETTSASADRPATAPAYTGQLPEVPAGAATTDCAFTPDGGPAAKQVEPPAGTDVPAEGTVSATLDTSAGPIGLTLDRAAAPCAVASFTSLAEQGYFDGSPCHRISVEAPLQMLQCGDPTGTGTGGPGYGFDTEYPETAYPAGSPDLRKPVVYPRGTIAMANTGAPGSNGSQFFLVYEDSTLPPNYTAFGTIDGAGLATVEAVAAAGDDGSSPAGGGAPRTPVTIDKAVVG